MKALLSLIVCCFVGFSALAGKTNSFDPSAAAFKGFIEVAPGRELYVDYVKAKNNQPTVILLNGLTYSTRQWDAMTFYLLQKGIGVVRYDMYGQGMTLLKYAPITAAIPYLDQVADLKVLLTKMQLKAPYNFAGLSYGGGIAAAYAEAYSQDIKNIILISPYTMPLSNQDKSILRQIQATRIAFPMNPATDDELYDFFLRQNVYTTYPLLEPIVLENPYKLDATFHLVQGIRKYFPVKDPTHAPPGGLHMMVARQDQYITMDVFDAYWDAAPVATHGSRLRINGSEHKIPEAVAFFAAGWISNILSGDALYTQGRDFEGWPIFGEARTSDGVAIPVGF